MEYVERRAEASVRDLPPKRRRTVPEGRASWEAIEERRSETVASAERVKGTAEVC